MRVTNGRNSQYPSKGHEEFLNLGKKRMKWKEEQLHFRDTSDLVRLK